MKQNIIKWTATGLLLLTAITFFLPWLSLHVEEENLRAVAVELETAGLEHTAGALADGRLSAFETAGVTLELGGLFGSDAWLESALGITQSSAELTQLRFVCIVFVAVFCLTLIFLLCDLVLCIGGSFLCGEKRTLRLLGAVAAPLFVGLLLLLYWTAARLLPNSLLSLRCGMAAAAVCALGAAVFGLWAALVKKK